MEGILGNEKLFLDKVFENLKSVGISLDGRQIDHLAARPKTNEAYDNVKQQLLTREGILLGEKLIQDRRVCIIKRKEPLQYKDYSIPCIELLAPVEGGKTYTVFLEHIEVVINDKSLKEFMEDHPNAKFLTNKLDKELNPELVIVFANDANVKFHPLSIEEVLELEKKSGQL